MKENQLAGLFLLPVAFFGMLFNWIVIIIIVKENMLNTSSFMFLTFIKSLCDGLHMTCYLFFGVPMVFLADPFLIFMSSYVSYGMIILFEISVYTHFVTSLNRFVAVFFPMSYKRVFSIESTRKYAAFFAFISVTMVSIVNFIFGCRIKYNPNSFEYFYDTTLPICQWYVMYGDFMKNLCLVSVDFGIDLVTLFKVQKMRRQFRMGKITENYTKKETDFLKQIFGQGFCYLMGYTSYLMVPQMENNKFVAFFMSVISWGLIAMLAGLFTIVFNCEIRTKLIKEKNTKSSVISVTPSKR